MNSGLRQGLRGGRARAPGLRRVWGLAGLALGLVLGAGAVAAEPTPVRWGGTAGPRALRLSFAHGAAIEGTGELGLVHLVEHLRAEAPRGALPGRAWTEHDGWSLGLSVGVDAEPAGVEALLSPLGAPLSAAALAQERAVILEEALAQTDEQRLIGALRRAALGEAHPYARPALGAPEAPAADVLTAAPAAILALEARALAGPRLLLSVGPGASPAGALGPPPLRPLDSTAPPPGPPRALAWGRGAWRVWSGPAAADPDARGLRALALALRRRGVAARAWAGRAGGFFALALDRRAARRPGTAAWPGLLGRDRPLTLAEDDVQRAILEQRRVGARPDLLAEQAAACWLHGRALGCGWEDAALADWSPAALRAVAARWLGAAAGAGW